MILSLMMGRLIKLRDWEHHRIIMTVTSTTPSGTPIEEELCRNRQIHQLTEETDITTNQTAKALMKPKICCHGGNSRLLELCINCKTPLTNCTHHNQKTGIAEALQKVRPQNLNLLSTIHLLCIQPRLTFCRWVARSG